MLPVTYYRNEDVLEIAMDLLGKVLIVKHQDRMLAGIIAETEAYNGIVDRASHAYGGKRTPRTEIMYAEGGVAYIYLCYGMYSLFNVVTNKAGIPHAVLIRALIPVAGNLTGSGFQYMGKPGIRDADGPGKLTRVMGLHYSMSGVSLLGPLVWIEDHGFTVKQCDRAEGPRIGVEYAGSDALLPYRFRIRNPIDWVNKWTS